MTDRRCAGCWEIKPREDMIKITRSGSDLIVNPDSLTFGRSAYLCYNKTCIDNAFKKNKLAKLLKISIPKELKGQLLDGLRNN